jgi:hypothetical protein
MDQPTLKRMGQQSSEIISGYSPRKFGLSIASIADASSEQTGMAPQPGGAQ